jgi:hypothetical protein
MHEETDNNSRNEEQSQISQVNDPMEITVDVSEQEGATVQDIKRDIIREKGARWIGIILFSLFGIALLISLFIPYWLTSIAIESDQTKSVSEVISEITVPVITEYTNFLQTIFLPLITFVLGYYFRGEMKLKKE